VRSVGRGVGKIVDVAGSAFVASESEAAPNKGEGNTVEPAKRGPKGLLGALEELDGASHTTPGSFF
jgi:hypothetical protein